MKKAIGFSICLLALSLTVQAVTVTGRVQVMGRAGKTKVTTIVYAEPLDRQQVQSGTFSMSQRNTTFSPAVLPVPAGSVVKFPNDDSIFHNVFSLSRPGPFDLGLYRAGASQSRTFSTPAVYRIFCNIHPQMSAVVLVLPTAYFVEADSMGRYRLDLPSGRYRVTAWSDRAPQTSSEITVAANPLNAVDLMLDESRYVQVEHKNKMGQDYPLIAYDPLNERRIR